MATQELVGVFTALVTPFSADGNEIDWIAFERLVGEQLSSGVRGLVPCGTTGEAPTLTDSERRELFARCARLARGKAMVLAGTGTNNTKSSIDAARNAVEAGADAVMVVMPYYSKPSQEGLFQHVAAIAQSVSVPIVLYNVPSRSVAELSVDTTLRLLDACPNVAGIKDASGNVLWLQEFLLRAKREVSVLCGDDPLTVPMMSVGARGVISVTSNLYPKQMSEIVDAALAGRYTEAKQQSLPLFPVHRVLFSEPSPAPTKAALAAKGRMNASVRLPIVEASAECRARIAATLAAYEAS